MKLFNFKNADNGNGVPRDENGNPLYSYVKVESINGKENYKYRIWGDPLFIPNRLDGGVIPVASMFIDWYSGDCYIMRNDGWHLLGDERPGVVDLETPVASITDTANATYGLTDTGEVEERFVGSILCKVPIYSATNTSTIYEFEKIRDLAINLADLEGYTFRAYKDGEEIEDLSTINCDLSNKIEFIILENESVQEMKYGVIINFEAELTPDPEDVAFKVNAGDVDYNFGWPGTATDISTFEDFIASDYNPVAEGEAYLEKDSGHVLLIVNETSATYHVQDNEEDVAATDTIENGKTYTGVE